MADTTLLEVAVRAARDSCPEVFRSLGIELPNEVAEWPSGTAQHEGIVALTAPQLLAACHVAASSAFLRRLSPVPLPDSVLAEWVGELANQLAGRLKFRFACLGLETDITLPSLATGRLAVFSYHEGPGREAVSLVTNGFAVRVFLDVEPDALAPAESDGSTEEYSQRVLREMDIRGSLPPSREP